MIKKKEEKIYYCPGGGSYFIPKETANIFMLVSILYNFKFYKKKIGRNCYALQYIFYFSCLHFIICCEVIFGGVRQQSETSWLE